MRLGVEEESRLLKIEFYRFFFFLEMTAPAVVFETELNRFETIFSSNRSDSPMYVDESTYAFDFNSTINNMK